MSKGFTSSALSRPDRPACLEAAALSQRLHDCFATITDPRVERTRLHQLSDILTIAILSVIAGGNGWEDMEVYGLSKAAWLSTFLALPNGIPSADTFRRVFERIHARQFEQCFEQWIKQLVDDLGIQVIAIDGKALKGSYDRETGKQTLHLVSAWATEHRLVLAQTKVQDKSNEITAIPALLELLDITGCIVTLDAMGTQKTIAQQIYTAKADYILSLKANHPTLFQDVDTWFQTARAAATLPTPTQHTLEAGHHRTEIRKVWTLSLNQFSSLHQAGDWALQYVSVKRFFVMTGQGDARDKGTRGKIEVISHAAVSPCPPSSLSPCPNFTDKSLIRTVLVSAPRPLTDVDAHRGGASSESIGGDHRQPKCEKCGNGA
jgi:predicted transposase YbfD/YdcC